MIGTLLSGRYTIEQQVGAGGMGAVYLAVDTLLERSVAVKMLVTSGLGTAGKNRLLNEARAIARLNHPNIISVFDAGETDEGPYLVMEYIEGQALNDPPPASLEDALEIVRQICLALEHAHQRGIIHRDIKPENILITAEGVPKLMDFGLARSVASRVSVEGSFAGTVYYIAPEQALGETVDQRADLYSLGVLLYEIAVGQLPFQSDDAFSVITQHLHAPVVPPLARNPGLPAALNDLILRLLAKRREDRPARAGEVAAALETVLEGMRKGLPQPEAEPRAGISVLDQITRGRLVGREKELGDLRAAWRRAVEGSGQVVLISGEPGIGKSRLVQELVTLVDVCCHRAYVGECYPDGNAPYGAFGQVLFRLLDDLPEARPLPDFILADLLTLYPPLRLRFPDVPPGSTHDPQAEQVRLLENAVSVIKMHAADAPVLIVLEDVHWADSGTLALMRHLARAVRSHPIMLLATYREMELDRNLPFQNILAELTRERLGIRIKLKRLDPDGTRAMLKALFNGSISSNFIAAVYRETEGNPFFIEEVVKSLVEAGRVSFEDGSWIEPSLEDLQIPQSIRVAIQQRIAKLPESLHETLNLAAIFGREFYFETLAAASGLTDEALIEQLETMERAQLIEETGQAHGGRFRFVHALIPSTIVDSLSGLRRRRYHSRAAEVIAHRSPENFESLAYHTLASGDLEAGLEYSQKAGAKALQVYALDEARQHFTRAMEIADTLHEDELVLSLSIRIGEILDLSGHFLAAVDMFATALSLATDPTLKTDLTIRIGAIYAGIGDVRGLDFLAEARKTVTVEKQPGLMARLLTMTARYYHYQSQHARAAELLEEARQIAAREAPGELIHIYPFLAGATQHLLRMEESNAWAQKCLELGSSLKDPLTIALGYEFFSENANLLGQFQDALVYATKNQDLGRQTGSLARVGWGLFSISYAHYGLGEFHKAVEIGEEGLALAVRMDDYRLQIWFKITLSAALNRLGEVVRAVEIADEAVRAAGALNQTILICGAMMMRAQIHNQLGEWDRTVDLYNQAVSMHSAGENRVAYFYTIAYGLEALIHVGRAAEAAAEAERAMTLADQLHNPHFMSMAKSLRARSLAAEGDLSTAIRMLNECREYYAAGAARFDLALTEYSLMHCYRAAGDEPHALTASEAAAAGFKSCGASPWSERLRRESGS